MPWGGVLNILLDPLFIFSFGLEIRGAAIATMLSNLAAMGFFAVFLCRIRKKTVITASLSQFTLGHHIPAQVISVGLPGFLMTTMSTLSNTVLNHIIAGYSSEAIAGMGIAKKIGLLAFAISQGMTQGVLPLIGYNYASGDHARCRKAIRTALFYSVLVALVGTVLLFFLAGSVVRAFIGDAQTVEYGRRFLRIICLARPTTAVNFMVITVFHAIGKHWQPLILSLLRKGSLDVLLMLLFDRFFGITGVPWATPVADGIAFIISVILILPYLGTLGKKKV